jgi:hypothetical protein
VDHVLETFKSMNEVMRKAKSFKPVAKKEELLQMVATNNLLFLDIISKLGIMERFDIAWKNNNCNDIYEHLRTDMEIENRNSNLQVKVGTAPGRLFAPKPADCEIVAVSDVDLQCGPPQEPWPRLSATGNTLSRHNQSVIEGLAMDP